MKFKIFNILTIICIINLFLFSSIENKVNFLSLGSKIFFIVIFIYFSLKLLKEKCFWLILINTVFTLIILFLSNNPLKNGMMNNIEMYYVDKFPANEKLIDDNVFSNEASHQKFYSIHANEVKPSLLDYLKLSKKLKYNKIYYYELCLFFKDNLCVFNYNRIISNEDYIHEKYDYQYNKLKFYYRDIELINDYKEGILKRDNNFENYKDIKDLNCLYTFYGAQNGWILYKTSLLNKLKNNVSCYEELNNHFKFAEKEYLSDNKENLINFLKELKQ